MLNSVMTKAPSVNDQVVDRNLQNKAGAPGNGYPLTMARTGEQLLIASMHGGRRYRRQLMDMGLRPGMQIIVLRASARGPVLIAVGETRLGIGRGMAGKIEVVPVNEVGSR